MKIDLKKYLGERDKLKMSKEDGPVLTISRQYGCNSNKIVMKLLHRINSHVKKKKGTAAHWRWRYISKEIIDDSASELGLVSKKIEQQILRKEMGAVGDFFHGLSQHYTINDEMLVGTVKSIIEDYARAGNVIIIGRGAFAVTQNMKSALHVRFIAPLDFRIDQISKKRDISKEEAEKLIKEVDQHRKSWTENLSGKEFTDSWFNIILNREHLSEEEIVHTIFTIMENRGMF